jgi:predicted outer membrane lipoprotein
MELAVSLASDPFHAASSGNWKALSELAEVGSFANAIAADNAATMGHAAVLRIMCCKEYNGGIFAGQFAVINATNNEHVEARDIMAYEYPNEKQRRAGSLSDYYLKDSIRGHRGGYIGGHAHVGKVRAQVARMRTHDDFTNWEEEVLAAEGRCKNRPERRSTEETVTHSPVIVWVVE